MNNISSYYFGTEIDRKWWKRYKKDNFFARGNGTFKYDKDAFYFYKYPSDTPIVIPLKDITNFNISKWHAGRWGGNLPILQIIWKKDNMLLSSGFILYDNEKDLRDFIDKLTLQVFKHS